MRDAIAELNGCDRQPPAEPRSRVNTNAEDAGRKLTERLDASGLSGLRVSTAVDRSSSLAASRSNRLTPGRKRNNGLMRHIAGGWFSSQK